MNENNWKKELDNIKKDVQEVNEKIINIEINIQKLNRAMDLVHLQNGIPERFPSLNQKYGEEMEAIVTVMLQMINYLIGF